MQKRIDLQGEKACLETPPNGYDQSFKPTTTSSAGTHLVSTFTMGEGAAGHYTEGNLYRLFVKNNSSCYEFETRVGQSQFANYPAGTIKEFTQSDKIKILNELDQILSEVSLSGEKNLFHNK